MSIQVLAWFKEKNRNENPYNYLLYKDMGADVQIQEFDYRKFSVKNANILHVHWPDRLLDDKRRLRLRWRFTRFLRAIDKLHSCGGKLVWTVHNLRSREVIHGDITKNLMGRFVERVDGLIFLSEISRELFLKDYPDKISTPFAVIPHMHYRTVYQCSEREKNRERQKISREEFVLGIFGKVRANKGIETVTDLFEQLPMQDCRLLIAGDPGKRGVSAKLKTYLEQHNNAIALLHHIDNKALADVFALCDAMILPYKDILNSGTALLALSLNTPIIAPDIGSFPELQAAVGSEWVHLYSQALDQKKLTSALEWAKALQQVRSSSPDGRPIAPNLSSMDPDRVSKTTADFYRRLLSR